MNRNVFWVLLAQFLTAFADNAILFTAITMVMHMAEPAGWYVPALQASFLVAFVVLAPWVGPYADGRAKARVLTTANVVKAAGAGLMLLQVEPILSYAVVGLGAAMYSPAKYGILPELVSEDELVKANGWVEGSTILAILLGMLIGALLSEYSISLALGLVIVLYVLSGLTALLVARVEPQPARREPALPHFINLTRRLLSTPRARFATLGVSLFWGSSVVLRVLIVAWAPAVLMLTQTSEIAELTMFLALGIALGALIVPKLIPLAYLRRARMAAYAMGAVIVLLAVVNDLWVARAVLFIAGVAGGLFVVPINAALQEIGHKSVGSGGAVAVQNFFENLAMLVCSGLYSMAAGLGAQPVITMMVLGVVVMFATVLVSWHLPPDTGKVDDLVPKQ
jgi:LPLT family lysophospholipid transporter-like MFS transporter